MVNGFVQNRKQPRLEVLNDIGHTLDVDVRDLIMPKKVNDRHKRNNRSLN